MLGDRTMVEIANVQRSLSDGLIHGQMNIKKYAIHCTYNVKIEVRSRNNCCRGKAISVCLYP